VNDMSGKTVLITGASSGIGRETAIALAEKGAHVVMIVRNRERGEAVKQEILAQNSSAQVDILLADLSSMEEVQRVASEFKSKYNQLHVLINNAGGVFGKRMLSRDGYEMTIALNYFAPFLLTNELLDVLKASAPSRIVNVSSNAHRLGRVEFDNMRGERSFGGMRVYGSSKLMLLAFTYELARRLEGTGVTVNALHPGFVATNFGKSDAGRVTRGFFGLVRPFQKTPKEGAETSIYLASSEEIEGVTGKYFVDSRPAKSSSASTEVGMQKALWLWTVDSLHLESSRCTTPLAQSSVQS